MLLLCATWKAVAPYSSSSSYSSRTVMSSGNSPITWEMNPKSTLSTRRKSVQRSSAFLECQQSHTPIPAFRRLRRKY